MPLIPAAHPQAIMDAFAKEVADLVNKRAQGGRLRAARVRE
jgi:hypothetical protein